MSEEKLDAPAEPKALADEAPATAADKPQDYFDQLIRLKADFENYRKRVDREKPDWYKMGRAEVLVKLLPLYDLLQNAHAEVKSGHADSPLAKGMEAIFKEFDKIFKEEGLTRLDPLGKPFDPHYHEAFGFIHKTGYDEGAVADVMQAGFLIGDKVLRTAKVRLQKKQ